uniref:WW domain binding protein 1 n=1 Tax=Leptobrachium leishanense TaxID=445787 RepID=A0A8C5MRX5_9ANUR
MRREELELGVRGSVYGREFCFRQDGKPYRCEIGYCCGDTECCTYYYELWWFWLAWTLIILIGCCCAYRHRRVKLRNQQEQRQREISLMAYQGVAPLPSAYETWPSCKLPSYSEVTQAPPSPPPPYCEVLDENPLHQDFSPPPRPVSQSLDIVGPGQGSLSDEAQGRTQNHTALNSEDGRIVAVERRRHITGDSGIVLCELDIKAACQMERKGKNGSGEGHACTEAIDVELRERGEGASV